MVEILPKKLNTDTNYSNNKLTLTKFSNKMKCSMFSELPEVKEFKVSLKDSVLHINKKKHIEVIEELDVSEVGIQLE